MPTSLPSGVVNRSSKVRWSPSREGHLRFQHVGEFVDRYDDADTLDVGDRIVMLGLINAHTHFGRTLTRGEANQRGNTADLQEMQKALCWKPNRALSDENVYLRTLIGPQDSV